MTDLFEEVEEQLRSDRYRALARRTLPWVLGAAAAVLIAVLAYWGWDTWRSRAVAQASEQYNAAIEAASAGDMDKARQLWSETSKSSARGYKALALMHLAGLLVLEDKTEEAVARFDEAAQAAPDEIVGDLARLKSAFALLDTAPYAEVEGRLTPLTKEGRPYRLQAREGLAFAKLMAGDAAGARGDFVVISQSLDSSDTARSRAQAAIGLIDSGSAKSIPAVARTAQALKPPMVVEPGAVIDGAQAPTQPQSQANGPQ